MAKDVDEALKEVVAVHGAMGAEKAAEFLAGLAKAGRYARDVY
jgi:sulfite reductase (NADPH) flavoprotein alpha-component